ncbi:hypothetical protein FRC04_010674 [Tulasnella sp. 424]|nr:hypothetical protein FRC04_010674 [Tulasnella sp. 424]KAG8972396.1 hypothetical protein FRC05_010107 [Tulasnella sp. 425]
MADNEDINAYELLEIEPTATEAEIKKAYRQKSLKVHPDRHPNNPQAAQKFHELNTAYELLLDPTRRTALDTKLKAQQAKKLRFASYDNKRKVMMEELEKSEREFKKSRLDAHHEAQRRQQEEEMIKEEGRRLMREKQEAMSKLAEEKGKQKAKEEAPSEAPSAGPLDTTIRLKFSPATYPDLTTSENIAALLKRFGPLDESSIVLSIKPNKKNPSKPPKHATALVPFNKVDGAFAAVLASGRKNRGLDGIEVSWAEGKEPDIVAWLKERGHLGSGRENGGAAASGQDTAASSKAAGSGGAFSSFPDDLSFDPEPIKPPIPAAAAAAASGLDFESLTFMRMRQAERERLEREILEADAQEEA